MPAKEKDENKIAQEAIYLFERIEESNILENSSGSHILMIQLPAIARDILTGNGCIFEGISPMNACLVNQSVFYQVLNAVVLTNAGVV